MIKYLLATLTVIAMVVLETSRAMAVTNPDQISVFFPALEGPENLGLNVSTVLSLQLAQTTRRYPWPDNPENHEFGEGMIRYSVAPLEKLTHSAANEAAQNRDLRAQLAIWGRTYRYGVDVIAEVNVTLPHYRLAPSFGCLRTDTVKCDYRQKNFEIWQIKRDGNLFSVDVPRRRFGISAIVLKPEVVERFSEAAGLTIRDAIRNGEEIGMTDSKIRFIEFNKKLPGAPTKLRSGGVEGYVSLPELSEHVSEYADMIGGMLQVFRGDWDEAVSSFSGVLINRKTRTPLKVDAMLYRGMAETRRGGDGRADFAAAAELAPYDHMVTRYQVMGFIAINEDKTSILRVIDAKSYLFSPDDLWLKQVKDWLKSG